MRILIYGAGVQGSFLAHVLDNSGHDVKILARGKRAKQLRDDGMVLRHYFQRKTTVNRIEVIEELKNDDLYDIIFVTMKYNDFQSVLPILAQNTSENIVLVGNNATASEMQQYIESHSVKKKNVVFGFQMSGGKRTETQTYAIRFDAGEMKVGSLHGEVPFRAELEKVFKDTKYKITFEDDIDAWLKNHLIFVLSLNLAAQIKHNDFKAIAKDDRLLKRITASTREGYKVLEALGYQLIPKSQADFIRKHRHLSFLFFKLYHMSPLTNFIDGSFEEIIKLCDDFYEMKKGLNLRTPSLDRLKRRAYRS